MTSLGLRCGRAWILPISLEILAAAGGVACSGGGGMAPDAGAGSGGLGAAGTGPGGAGTGGAGGTGADGGSAAGAGGTASAGIAGGAGAAGAGRGGAAGGTAGTGGRPAGTCTFDVQHTQSWAIGTVEIVTWTLDVADLTEAHIDFGPSGAAPTMTAPADLRAPLHRTVLVGMKGAKPYTFRIVATDGVKTCTSADFSFTTGAVPGTAPKIMKTAAGTGAAKGFIVTSPGVHVSGEPSPDAYIFDTDGDLVWWSSVSMPGSTGYISRAHISWDAKSLWVATNSGATFLCISMDGLSTTDYSNILSRAHHDFAVLPNGGIATMLNPVNTSSPDSIVEMKPDGTVTTIVADVTTLYRATSPYPNAIHYYPADDSYTLSDRGVNAYIKFKRNGTLVWQLGGSNPLGKSFTLVGLEQWMVNHGHHLTADGHFLFFNNVGTTDAKDMPRALEVLLDETNNTATKTWEFQSSGLATALGDAERLPNGNALVTNSLSGLIQEVDRSGKVVQSFKYTSFGYVDFRTSLYGPPPR